MEGGQRAIVFLFAGGYQIGDACPEPRQNWCILRVLKGFDFADSFPVNHLQPVRKCGPVMAYPAILRIGQPVCQKEDQSYDNNKEGAMKAELAAQTPPLRPCSSIGVMNRRSCTDGAGTIYGMFWIFWMLDVAGHLDLLPWVRALH